MLLPHKFNVCAFRKFVPAPVNYFASDSELSFEMGQFSCEFFLIMKL